MVRAHVKQTPEEKKENQKTKPPARKKSTEVGTWPCKINGCNKVFAREADLKRHQRTTKSHSIPSFACSQCDATFTRADALRRHQKSRHNNAVANSATADDSKADPDDVAAPPSDNRQHTPEPEPEPPSTTTSKSPASSSAGPSSYYRQQSMHPSRPPPTIPPPPAIIYDPHYPHPISMPTSAARLHPWPPAMSPWALPVPPPPAPPSQEGGSSSPRSPPAPPPPPPHPGPMYRVPPPYYPYYHVPGAPMYPYPPPPPEYLAHYGMMPPPGAPFPPYYPPPPPPTDSSPTGDIDGARPGNASRAPDAPNDGFTGPITQPEDHSEPAGSLQMVTEPLPAAHTNSSGLPAEATNAEVSGGNIAEAKEPDAASLVAALLQYGQSAQISPPDNNGSVQPTASNSVTGNQTIARTAPGPAGTLSVLMPPGLPTLNPALSMAKTTEAPPEPGDTTERDITPMLDPDELLTQESLASPPQP